MAMFDSSRLVGVNRTSSSEDDMWWGHVRNFQNPFFLAKHFHLLNLLCSAKRNGKEVFRRCKVRERFLVVTGINFANEGI